MGAPIAFHDKTIGKPGALHGSGGSAHVADGFKPSVYATDLTMDGTAQTVALASGVKLGAGRVRVVNQGPTTEAIRVAFGTSAANAVVNLTMTGGTHATTGTYLPALADAGAGAIIILGVDALATHIAVANAAAADTAVVSVEQGI